MMRSASLLCVALSVGCGAGTLGVDPSGPGCLRDFGSNTAASKVETYLLAVHELASTSDALDRSARQACLQIGAVAGLPPAVLASRDPGVICEAAFATMGPDIRLAPAPSTCSLDPGPFRECLAACELRYRPTDIQVTCDQAPTTTPCTGVLATTQGGPRCTAACTTRAELAAECSTATVEVVGPPGPLTEALTAAAPRLVDVIVRSERLIAASERLARIAPILPDARAVLSIRAVACASAAATRVLESEGRLERLARLRTALASHAAP